LLFTPQSLLLLTWPGRTTKSNFSQKLLQTLERVSEAFCFVRKSELLMMMHLSLNQILDVRNEILTMIRTERKTFVANQFFECNIYSWFEIVPPEPISVPGSYKFLAHRGPQRNI
jgi:hypothetical protein